MDILSQAKKAKSVEELTALLKNNHIDITLDEASAYFDKLNPKSGEMDDDELDSVAGGCTENAPSGSTTTKPRLYPGKVVSLKNEGHSFGASADYKPSQYCTNPRCACRTFYIVNQINDTKYLIACNRCGWTYWAEEKNIV